MEKALSLSGLMMNQVGPRNTAISSGFYSLIRAIRRANSKAEEESIIQKELDLIRQNLAQPDVSQKKMKEFLVRLVYCEMLGQSASFAYIHALKMAQQGSLLNKRVGYLAVCLFLHPEHELILLLINTLQKDLRSTNILDVCVGLTACSQLISAEMIPAILPHVEEKLQHPQEAVRKKAVLVLHSFLLRSPQLISQMGEQFQQALCDRAAGVMGAALHIYHTLILHNPSQHVGLVRPLTSILLQVVQRKLSADFEYRGVPAPWMQIQILKMLARLGSNNPKTSQLMFDILEEVLDASSAIALVSCGVQYECIMTIAKIHPKPSLLKKAADCISRFLRTRSNNLRYLGLRALGAIHKVFPECSVEHQMTVVECLEDEDPTIRKATLNLLYQMCNKDNIEVISEKLLDCLESTSEDDFSKKGHLHKIVHLAQHCHPSVRWYVDTILKILSLDDQGIPQNTLNCLITAIQQDTKDSALPTYLVQKVLPLSSNSMSDDIVQFIAWILGEYGCSEKSPIPASEALAVLCSLLSRPSHTSAQARSCVMSAITKAAGRSGLVTEAVTKAITAGVSSRDVEVRQKAYELRALCNELEMMNTLCNNHADAAVQTSQFDWTLSFLDEYVGDALELGAAPYKPKQQRSAEKHNSPEVMRPFLSGLKFKPYASPAASMLTPTGSSGSLPHSTQEPPGPTPLVPSPGASLSSGATGNSAENDELTRSMGLKTEGLKRVWSQTGYKKPGEGKKERSPKHEKTAPQPDTEQPGMKTSQQATVQMTPVSAVGMTTMHRTSLQHPGESEEEKRKQELAKALFGNIRKQSGDDKVEEMPKWQSNSASLDRKLQELDLKHTEGQTFADRCTKDGLLIMNESRTPKAPEFDSRTELRDHDILLNIGINETFDHHMTTNPQKDQFDNVLSDNPFLGKAKQQVPLDSVMRNENKLLETNNQVVHHDRTKPIPSLLDMDDAAQTVMMTSSSAPRDLGELPSLPAEYGESPSSHVTEELVFDTNVRLVMRRVWHPASLVLAFYVSSLAGKMEGVKLTLDVPSNMKCFCDEKETKVLEVGAVMVESPVLSIARLTCQVPAPHMSLGGELTYKNPALTIKRLFFQTHITLKDLLRPKELTTEEFGKLWPEYSLDHRLVFEVKGHSIPSIMSSLRSVHMFPVEIIGNEGIIASSLLSVSTCLIHIKLEGPKLDLWVRSKSKLLSQVVAKNCTNLLRLQEDGNR